MSKRWFETDGDSRMKYARLAFANLGFAAVLPKVGAVAARFAVFARTGKWMNAATALANTHAGCDAGALSHQIAPAVWPSVPAPKARV